jgi:hypothetical protein
VVAGTGTGVTGAAPRQAAIDTTMAVAIAIVQADEAARIVQS